MQGSGYEPWLAYALVFLAVVVAVQLGLRGLGDASRIRHQTARRRDGLAAVPGEAEAALRRRRPSRWRALFGGRLAQVVPPLGTIPISRLVLVGAVLTLAVFVVLPLPSVASRAALSILIAGAIVVMWLRIRVARRRARFGEQLPDVLDVIVRSLRAGHPLAVSLALVAREMPEPAGPEFALVVEEVNYGRSVSEALEGLQARIGYPDLQFFVAATAIAHQTGGNLGEILARLATLLRQRFRLKRRIRALSAEGRFSGLALSALPVALFALINVVSASYYGDFWKSPSATTVAGVSVALLLVGNLVIFRLVNFKV